jgi:hypothetical protein
MRARDYAQYTKPVFNAVFLLFFWNFDIFLGARMFAHVTNSDWKSRDLPISHPSRPGFAVTVPTVISAEPYAVRALRYFDCTAIRIVPAVKSPSFSHNISPHSVLVWLNYTYRGCHC